MLLWGVARADDAETWAAVYEARLVASMYGDLDNAARLLQEPLDQGAAAERPHALYWLARIHVERGNFDAARTLLEEAAGDPLLERRARVLLARISLHESALGALPVSCGFERDQCGLRRAWDAEDKGTLGLTELGDEPVLGWDTTVESAESDAILLALAPGLLPRTVAFRARVQQFPVDLRVEVEDGGGGRWASPPVRLPVGLWTSVEVPLADFTSLQGEAARPRSLRVVQLQDISGLLSPERGPNTILLDDLVLR